MTLAQDIALANRLADAAGDVIRPLFRAEFSLEDKPDQTPVTEADRGAEEAIRAILEDERPDEGIIGEEFGAIRETAATALGPSSLQSLKLFRSERTDEVIHNS